MRFLLKILTLALALCLAFSTAFAQNIWADEEATSDSAPPSIVELQEQVERASAAYNAATAKVAELKGEIEELNARIQEIQDALPGAREISNRAAREYYCMFSTSNPVLEMLFGATSLADFLAKVEYSTRLNQSYLDDITSLTRLTAELEEARAKLEAKELAAEEEQLHAEEALLDAQNARDVAAETARREAEAAAAATAAAAAAAAAADEASHETPLPPGPVSGGAGLPEFPTEKQVFVNLWAPRIDAYLSGSPMAGYGYVFANAAFDYNVDPRWSPAIACLESGKGRYCFLPYNAWGWGSVSWPDWETAIYAHVRGLSIGYGYTISEAAAKRYCPPNWEYWYSFVSNQMTLI